MTERNVRKELEAWIAVVGVLAGLVLATLAPGCLSGPIRNHAWRHACWDSYVLTCSDAGVCDEVNPTAVARCLSEGGGEGMPQYEPGSDSARAEWAMAHAKK